MSAAVHLGQERRIYWIQENRAKIHAVVLSGGSAFGLEAASGCVKYLAEQGVGFPIGNVCVPIVCSAVLFDLMIGDEKLILIY